MRHQRSYAPTRRTRLINYPGTVTLSPGIRSSACTVDLSGIGQSRFVAAGTAAPARPPAPRKLSPI